MNRFSPPPAFRRYRGHARVIKPTLIEEVAVAVRTSGPSCCWDRINYLSQFGFRLLDFIKRISEGLLRPLALDPLRDRVGNRCQRVENGFRKHATGEQRHHSDQTILDK